MGSSASGRRRVEVALLTDVGDGVDLVLLALELPVVVVSLALGRQVPDTHTQRLKPLVLVWVGIWAQTSFGLRLV